MSEDATKPTRLSGCFWIVLLTTIAWASATVYHALSTWPHVPMDISANDAATVQALETAVRNHAIAHALVALVPVLTLLPIAARSCRVPK